MGKVALHQQPIVSEGGARQTLRRFHRGRHVGGGIDDLHALAAASGAGLDDERKSHPRGFFTEALRRLFAAVIAGRHRHAHRRHRGLRCALRSHGLDRRRRGTDEDQARIDAGLREAGILGKKSIAGVNGIGADTFGERDELGDIEIALGGGRGAQVIRLVGDAHVLRVSIRIRIHRNRRHSQTPRRARDAANDFAAVGDQESSDHCVISHSKHAEARGGGFLGAGQRQRQP